MAITDHYFMDRSFELVKNMQEIDSGLKAFPGEEVHPFRAGEVFHVVNFNGKASVNKLYYENRQKADEEIANLAKTMGMAEEADNLELAHFKWIFDKIREVGGIAIYPHAFWQVGYAYNVRPAISNEILRRKLCDAFEIFGGMSKRDNREMAQYAMELKADGINLPFVASSDAHSALKVGNVHFGDVYSIAFAETADELPDTVLKGQVVAVDNFNPDDKTVYGSSRLVRYAYFLLEHYYAMHDELCAATGNALLRYVLGDKEQKELVERLDNERKKYDKLFFGN
jgi:predicted metal-dependent phosphoesterase TrpH